MKLHSFQPLAYRWGGGGGGGWGAWAGAVDLSNEDFLVKMLAFYNARCSLAYDIYIYIYRRKK